VRRITRRDRIFFCGHSMGGILGYGYAGIHDHFEGLVTIGAPAELGKGSLPLKLLAGIAPGLTVGVDAVLAGLNLNRGMAHAAKRAIARVRKAAPPRAPRHLQYRALPVDTWLKLASDALGYAEDSPALNLVKNRITWLTRWDRMQLENIRWMLREGGDKEPRKVMDQFARWIRNNETVCYRTGYDFKRGFGKIKVPMAIIFGDLDPLASVDSTRSVYRAARSDYLLWRPVKGNSHIELTMGHDARQICYDVKNLVEYAKSHRVRAPSLPRVR